MMTKNIFLIINQVSQLPCAPGVPQLLQFPVPFLFFCDMVWSILGSPFPEYIPGNININNNDDW